MQNTMAVAMMFVLVAGGLVVLAAIVGVLLYRATDGNGVGKTPAIQELGPARQAVVEENTHGV